MREDGPYLDYIDESIELIEEYLADAGGALSKNLFYDDLRTQDAVLRRMETLADTAGHLSDALKARYPEIPWRTIIGFRNVLAHAYVDLDLDLVWVTITGDLLALKEVVREELARAGYPPEEGSETVR